MSDTIDSRELTTVRAAEALHRALADDAPAQAQLAEAWRELTALQAALSEWAALRRALHFLLTAFSPFYAGLRTLAGRRTAAQSPARRALLQGWRPCQTAADALADCQAGAEHIRPPDWGARIAALRREVEAHLREPRWSVTGLLDVGAELEHACHCYIALADGEIARVSAQTRRLQTHLGGGLS